MRAVFSFVVLSLMCFAAPHSFFGGKKKKPTAPVNWNSLAPTVRTVLKKQFPSEAGKDYESGAPVYVADITGDHVPEALVSLGKGEASTSELVLMRAEDNKPVVAPFEDWRGKSAPAVFLDGASVMNTSSVYLVPNDLAVFQFHYEYGSNNKLSSCKGDAYKWNTKKKTFNYDSHLSGKLTEEYCRGIPLSAQ